MKRLVVPPCVSTWFASTWLASTLASIFVAALISLLPSVTHAQGAPVKTGDATTLQLKYILAPVQTKPGAFTSSLRIITPILIIPNPDNSPLVCNRMPRVIEGLLSYFSQHPAPVKKNRHLDTDALDALKKTLAAHANRALGANVVSAVYIIEGGKTMSTGAAARFPGASSNACGAIMEENAKKIKAAQQPK